MRVIFLDFDGVLNHPGVYAQIEQKYGLGPEKLNNWHEFTEAEWLDPAFVARVGALAVETGATIAVISTWRNRHRRAELAYGGTSDLVFGRSAETVVAYLSDQARSLLAR